MITAIILAAGFSRRFGSEKLLLKLNDKSLITHVIDTVIKSEFKEIILVYQNEEIKKIAEKYKIKHIYNGLSINGMSSSLKCGISKASETDAYMFINGDQPFINNEIIETLIKTFYKTEESIVVPRYSGKRGNPVVFSSKWKKEFMNVTGDVGGRNIIKNNPNEVYYLDMTENKYNLDVDTQKDYLTIKEMMNND
ncbi:molybdenum cofactor cytidylyltransferase [Vallitalea sediminicola]